MSQTKRGGDLSLEGVIYLSVRADQPHLNPSPRAPVGAEKTFYQQESRQLIRIFKVLLNNQVSVFFQNKINNQVMRTFGWSPTESELQVSICLVQILSISKFIKYLGTDQ